MIVAGVLVDEPAIAAFKKLHVKDSKLVLPKAREIMAKEIKKLSLKFEIVEVLPEEIDKAVNFPGFNLNKLEASKIGYVINRLTETLQKNAKITAFIDCPSPNIRAWQTVLMGFVDRKDLDFKVEHKCDLNHVECAAASILAKVSRDAAIQKIKHIIKEDFGSGYPADPITVEFLKKNLEKYRHLKIFRESWQTFKNHASVKKQKALDEF
jgi:ribonuclease HII